MLKLWWAPQSRALRAVWMLEELGEPYERIRVDIRAADHPTAALLAVSPLGKVPALQDGAVSVAESGAILAYLADRFPTAGLAPPPGDPARGRYLQWLFFAAANLEAAFFQKLRGMELEARMAGWGSFDKVMAVLDAELARGPWILGERFSAVDVLLGSDLKFGREGLKIVPATPALEAYIARCAARPGYRRAEALDRAA